MNADDLKRLIERERNVLVCVLLAAVTGAIYWRVAGCEFTNFDEAYMILQNPYVLGGLTRSSVAWGLTTSYYEYWHPLTWWSHMLDCELFGVHAAGHHLVSAGLHVANTVLVFVVLRRMTTGVRNDGPLWRACGPNGSTGRASTPCAPRAPEDVPSAGGGATFGGAQRSARPTFVSACSLGNTTWRCALVAALFALHPLHVESVAWIAERKDVLSAFFFLLTLWAYAGYAEGQRLKAKGQMLKGEIGMQHPSAFSLQPSAFYLLALGFFALGLMSKPMVVTLPFVLLLLDFWPLRRICDLRFAICDLRRLFLEKVPFFALAFASCAITYFGVKAGGGLISATTVPWGFRVTNVPVAYARYLEKMLWPEGLAVLYPMPDHWAWWQVGGALGLLALCSFWAVARVRRQPWLAVGWLWFVGTLVPVIGLVQVGRQAMADRYTYISLLGVFIAVVWSAAEWLRAARVPRWVAWAASGLVLAGCAAGTWAQLGTWRDSVTLWSRALAVTTRNARAHHNYGLALFDLGQPQAALAQYREALRLDPDQVETLNNLGCLLVTMAAPQEGTNYLLKALRLNPKNNQVRVNLGRALIGLGDCQGAREYYEAAMAARSDDVTIPLDWGKVLLEHNQPEEAMEHFGQALQLIPRLAEARSGYASALAQSGAGLAAQGKAAEAVGRYRQALMMQADLPEVLNNLAWLLATANDAQLRNGAEAVRSAQQACELTQNRQAMFVGTLAAAYAEDGQFEAARRTAQEAIALAEAAGQTNLVARNRELLRLYEAGKPVRQ